MLDRPTRPKNLSNSVNGHRASSPPTLVLLRRAEPSAYRLMKRSAGLGGLALLAAIGWSTLRYDLPSGRTAVDGATADLEPRAAGDRQEPAPKAAAGTTEGPSQPSATAEATDHAGLPASADAGPPAAPSTPDDASAPAGPDTTAPQSDAADA